MFEQEERWSPAVEEALRLRTFADAEARVEDERVEGDDASRRLHVAAPCLGCRATMLAAGSGTYPLVVATYARALSASTRSRTLAAVEWSAKAAT